MAPRYPRREVPDDNGVCFNRAFWELWNSPPGSCASCLHAAKQRISGTCLVCGAQHEYGEGVASDGE